MCTFKLKECTYSFHCHTKNKLKIIEFKLKIINKIFRVRVQNNFQASNLEKLIAPKLSKFFCFCTQFWIPRSSPSNSYRNHWNALYTVKSINFNNISVICITTTPCRIKTPCINAYWWIYKTKAWDYIWKTCELRYHMKYPNCIFHIFQECKV